MKAVIAGYARTPFHFAKKGALAAVGEVASTNSARLGRPSPSGLSKKPPAAPAQSR